MNILHLSRHSRMDRRITGEMNYLARKGHKVVFLSTLVNLIGSGISSQIQCPGQVSKVSPPSKGTSTWKASRNERIRKFILSLPEFLAVPLYSFLIWIMDRRMYRKLETLLRTELPDFVPDYIHVHDLRLVEFAVHLRDVFPGVKLIYDSHELTPFQSTNRKISTYILKREKRAVHAVDTVITVNPSIAERMEALYGIPRPVVLYNSQETYVEPGGKRIEEIFDIAPLPDSAVKVLFQGSLTPNRNIDNMLKAFQILPEQFHLFVLGNGPEENSIRQMVSPQIHFHDAVIQTELQKITEQASFGIIPYLETDCENNLLCTPNKLFEFMNARLPICSAELPEIHKIFAQFGNGRCYPMDTPEKIAAAVRNFADLLAKGEITKDQLGFVADTYSYEKQITVLDKVYL
ncbi:MAG: glycosyltransferase family 4 protein [Lentisphaeria bacterium]|nr:glycosyltransferase family 4 protein [Lentisphaeria bacterium]